MTDRASARKILKKQLLIFVSSLAVLLLGVLVLMRIEAFAAPGVTIDFQADAAGEGSMGMLEVLFLFVLIALLPSILLMMTSFTRIIIVLSFMRNALGTQQSPPNQVLVGLALILTLFIMMPTIDRIRTEAYDPYKQGEITSQQALDRASTEMKRFMIPKTKSKTLNLFLRISQGEEAAVVTDDTPIEQIIPYSLAVIVPSFITSELERAFLMGFLLYLPFLIIDIVVSSVLMSMGMVMLPPAMISLPFKLLMFVMVDGWGLLMGTLVQGFG